MQCGLIQPIQWTSSPYRLDFFFRIRWACPYVIFTKEEGIVLMLIYSGVRVGEMINLEKTKPFFIEWLNDGTNQTEYLLCNDKGKRLNYTTFRRKIYDPFVKGLDIDLTPHCTRHTTISMLAEKHVSQTVIKKIVGHKGAMDITERVYTHLNIQELIDALNLI